MKYLQRGNLFIFDMYGMKEYYYINIFIEFILMSFGIYY